jgi:hypothetical protein
MTSHIHGVIMGRRRTDYVHGRVGALLLEVRNPSGNWTAYLPSAERQSNRRTETFACVSYFLLNVIETQVKFLTGQGLNFSDRWLAKMSGTTPAGNYLWAVADTVRLKGLVHQEDWPEPDDYTWDSYYATIPPEIQLKGSTFLENWTIAYEWIDLTPESLEKHLKQAPLQVVIPGHAIECFTFNRPEDIVRYFDTYDPFFKSTTLKGLSDALKVVLTPKGPMNQTKIVLGKDGKTVYKAIPVATGFENFKKQAAVEGIEVPNPIPPASSL